MKRCPVRQRPTALQDAVGEANIDTGGDLQILECEFCSAKGIRLPLAPTRPVRCRGCVLQRGEYVKNAYGCVMMGEHIVLPPLTRRTRPRLEQLLNCLSVRNH